MCLVVLAPPFLLPFTSRSRPQGQIRRSEKANVGRGRSVGTMRMGKSCLSDLLPLTEWKMDLGYNAPYKNSNIVSNYFPLQQQTPRWQRLRLAEIKASKHNEGRWRFSPPSCQVKQGKERERDPKSVGWE